MPTNPDRGPVQTADLSKFDQAARTNADSLKKSGLVVPKIGLPVLGAVMLLTKSPLSPKSCESGTPATPYSPPESPSDTATQPKPTDTQTLPSPEALPTDVPIDIDSAFLEALQPQNGLVEPANGAWAQVVANNNPSVAALQYMATAVERLGPKDGAVDMSKNEMLPANIVLARLTCNTLPEDATEADINTNIPGFNIGREAHMTVVGANGDRVLVMFDDFRRPNSSQVKLFMVTMSRADFTSLVQMNGGSIEGNKITLMEGQIAPLNNISDDVMNKVAEKGGETALFANKDADGNYYENPLVPKPPVENAGVVKQGDKVVALSQDGSGTVIMEASYNSDTRRWEWKETSNYEQRDGRWVYKTTTGAEILLPNIPGLTSRLENGILKYYSEAGIYMGEFKPDVFMSVEITGDDGKPKTETTNTGGLILAPDLALQTLNERLETITNQSDKWLVPLPLDAKGVENVNLSFEPSSYQGTTVMLLQIDFSGKGTLRCIGPLTEQVSIAASNYGPAYFDQLLNINPYTDHIQPGHEMRYIWVTASQMAGVSSNQTLDKKFGDIVSAGAYGPIHINYGSALDYFTITPDKILNIDGIPVFVGSQ